MQEKKGLLYKHEAAACWYYLELSTAPKLNPAKKVHCGG
jgi:hypothetical protein